MFFAARTTVPADTRPNARTSRARARSAPPRSGSARRGFWGFLREEGSRGRRRASYRRDYAPCDAESRCHGRDRREDRRSRSISAPTQRRRGCGWFVPDSFHGLGRVELKVLGFGLPGRGRWLRSLENRARRQRGVHWLAGVQSRETRGSGRRRGPKRENSPARGIRGTRRFWRWPSAWHGRYFVPFWPRRRVLSEEECD